MSLLEYHEHISVQAGCLEDRNQIFGIIGYPRLSNLKKCQEHKNFLIHSELNPPAFEQLMILTGSLVQQFFLQQDELY